MKWILGCAALFGAATALAGDRPLTQQDLNHGYAQVHAGLKQLGRGGKLLLVKQESDALDEVIGGVAGRMDELAEGLDRLDREDERLRLDEDGEAAIERLQDKAIMADRFATMKPVSGKTGRAFERELLLSYLSGMHQLRFLASTLDEQDADRRRSAYLAQAVREIDRSRDDVQKLLEREYFR